MNSLSSHFQASLCHCLFRTGVLLFKFVLVCETVLWCIQAKCSRLCPLGEKHPYLFPALLSGNEQCLWQGMMQQRDSGESF